MTTRFSLFILFLLAASSALAASAGPALQKSKQEAEAKGHVFHSSHDDIVKMAKQEAKVDGIVSLDPETFGPLTKAFKSRYPFLDLKLREVTGSYNQKVWKQEIGRRTLS